MIIQIESWKETYRQVLREMVIDFFNYNLSNGGDLAVTDNNITKYLEVGFSAAARGEPCYVGLACGEPIAFVMWFSDQSGLDRTKRAIIAGGSYTKREFRKQKIANILRQEARRKAIEMGFEKIQGPVFFANQRGMQEFEEFYQAKIVSVTFEKEI